MCVALTLRSKAIYDAFQKSLPKPDETAVFCTACVHSGEIKCSGRLSLKASYILDSKKMIALKIEQAMCIILS